MKRFLKAITYSFLFVLGCISLCFFPCIQKIFIQKMLSRHFDDVKIANVNINFYGANIKQFSIRQNDLTLRFSDLNISWSLKDLFVLKTLNISNASVSGLMFSVENDSKEALYYEVSKKITENEAENLLTKINLMLSKMDNILAFSKSPFSIASLNIQGSFDVYEKILGKFSVNLVNFLPSETANLKFDLTSSFSRGFDGKFSLIGNIELHRKFTGLIDQLKMNSSILSKNYTDKNQKTFSINAKLDNEVSSGDKFSLAFVDDQTSENILNISLMPNANSKIFNLNAKVQMTNALINYFSFGRKSEFWSMFVNLNGEYNPVNKNWITKANSNIVLSNKLLNKFLPKLDSDIRLRSTLALILDEKSLVINSLTSNLEDEKNAQIKCSCELKHSYRMPYNSLSPSNILEKLKGMEIDFDIGFLDTSIIGKICSDLKLFGIGQGKFTMLFNNGCKLFSSGEENPTLTDVVVLYKNNKVCQNLCCSSKINLSWKDQLKFELSEISFSEKEHINLLQGDCNIILDKTHIELGGYFVADLPNLLKQPMFRNELQVASGLASCNFEISKNLSKNIFYSGNLDLKLKAVSFSNLDNLPFDGEVHINLFDKNKNDEDLKFDITCSTRHVGDTDCIIHGVLSHDIDELSNQINIDVKSQSIYSSDVLPLVKIFQLNSFDRKNIFNENPNNNVQKKQLFNIDNDIKANVSIAVGNIYWKDISCCSDFSCEIKANNKTIEIPEVKCYIFNAPFNAKCSVNCTDKTGNNLFLIKTIFSLSNLYVNNCMLVLGLDQNTFTGMFSVKGSLASEDQSFLEALKGLRCNVQIVGKSGNIRPKMFLNNTQKGFLGLAGITSEIIGGQSSTINSLIDYFEDIKYDEILASIIRTNDKDIVLDNLSITNDDMRIFSRGKISYVGGMPLGYSNIAAEVQINAKEHLAELFDNLGLLNNSTDYRGYQIGPCFKIGGTIDSPDLSEFKSLILNIGSKMFKHGDNDEKSILNPGSFFKFLK